LSNYDHENMEDNLAFQRCADLMAGLMIKYGPRVLEKKKKRFLDLFSNTELQIPQNGGAALSRLIRYSSQLAKGEVIAKEEQ